MKTWQECKDEIARTRGYEKWELKIHENGEQFTENLMDIAAKSYVESALHEVLKRKHEANAKYAFQKGSWESVDNIVLMLIKELTMEGKQPS